MNRLILIAVCALAVSACGEDKAKEESPKSAVAQLSEAHAKSAKVLVDNYAHNAYALWAVQTGGDCPKSLAELGKLINKEPIDPYKQPLQMVCGDKAPAEANGFGVFSVGLDGKAGTDDDIRSWKPL